MDRTVKVIQEMYDYTLRVFKAATGTGHLNIPHEFKHIYDGEFHQYFSFLLYSICECCRS